MAIFLAGKAVCYRILAFFCYGKLHFKCESADLLNDMAGAVVISTCVEVASIL